MSYPRITCVCVSLGTENSVPTFWPTNTEIIAIPPPFVSFSFNRLAISRTNTLLSVYSTAATTTTTTVCFPLPLINQGKCGKSVHWCNTLATKCAQPTLSPRETGNLTSLLTRLPFKTGRRHSALLSEREKQMRDFCLLIYGRFQTISIECICWLIAS